MKKPISILLATIISLTAVFNLGVSSVSAATDPQYFKSIKFEVFPTGSSIETGYINATNTSFGLEVVPSEILGAQRLSLYLDDATLPLDTEVLGGEASYSLFSHTSSSAELELLLGSRLHEWKILAQDEEEGVWYEVASGEFVSDFVLPQAGFFAEQLEVGEHTSKVGDTVAIGLSEFPPTDDVSSVNGKIYGRDLTFNKKGKAFYADYVVTEGDQDQDENLPLTEASFKDVAGNIVNFDNFNIPIDFAIDANSPDLTVASPENKTYNLRDIPVVYESSDGGDVEFIIDGEAVVLSDGEGLDDLAEGEHEFRIRVTDEAGNQTASIIKFCVDTLSPSLSIESNIFSATRGGNIQIAGSGEPGLTAKLLDGDIVLSSTVCDQSGRFIFNLTTAGWSLGRRNLNIVITDGAGNSSTLALSVEVKSVPVVAKRSTKIASSSKVVAIPQSKVEPVDNSDLARAGRIISSNDFRPKEETNWTAWLILIGLVALAAAIATTSYYGFAWMSLNKNHAPLSNDNSKDIAAKLDSEFTIISDDQSKPESVEPEKENDPPEPPKSYTRW